MATVTLKWTNRFVGSAINVYRSTSWFDANSLPAPLVVLPGAALSYIDETAADATQYFYRVGVENGETPVAEAISGVVTVLTPDPGGVSDTFTPVELFVGAENGDFWEMNPDNTDAASDADPITAATGIVNSSALSTVLGTVTLEDVDGDRRSWAAVFGGDRMNHVFASSITQPATMFLVIQDDDVSDHVIITGASNSDRMQVSNDSTDDLIAFAGNELDSGFNSPIGRRIVLVEFNGASSKIIIDGCDGAELDAGTQSTSQVNLGALWDDTLTATMKVWGFGIIDRLLTSLEKQNLVEYGRRLMRRPSPPDAPDSIISLVTADNMEFSGGVLSAIDATKGPIPSFTGSPARGDLGGIAVTETSAAANFVEIDNQYSFLKSDPSNLHLAVCFRRNSTADDSVTGIGTSTGSDFAMVCHSTSLSTVTEANISIDRYRADAVDYLAGGASTRQQLWNAFMADRKARSVAMKDFRYIGGRSVFPMRDPTATTFNGEGEIMAWAWFTDWGQVDAVNEYLERIASETLLIDISPRTTDEADASFAENEFMIDVTNGGLSE